MAEKRKPLTRAEKLEIVDRMIDLPPAGRLELIDYILERSRPSPDDDPPYTPADTRRDRVRGRPR